VLKPRRRSAGALESPNPAFTVDHGHGPAQEAARAHRTPVDNRLLELLNERAGLALEVGRVKQNGVKYRPEREAQVLRRLAAAGAGPLRGPAVRACSPRSCRRAVPSRRR